MKLVFHKEIMFLKLKGRLAVFMDFLANGKRSVKSTSIEITIIKFTLYSTDIYIVLSMCFYRMLEGTPRWERHFYS